MKRAPLLVAMIVFSIVAEFSQVPLAQEEPSSKKEAARPRAPEVVSSSTSSGLESLLRPPTLDQLHDALRKYRDPHDTYLYIAQIGNEQSVPLLIERFRLDHGGPEPRPAAVYGFVCDQLHLVDALRSITNTDQGMFYPRWAAWWEANQGRSQHQWILDGFAAAGLHVVEPIDEPFGLELIEMIGSGHEYHAFNAVRLLAKLEPGLRAKWVARASTSEQKSRRLGAVRVLAQIDTTGQEDLLRALAADSDLEVRREALTTLNEHLHLSLEPASYDARVLMRTSRSNWIRAVTFVGDLLLVVLRDGEVQAFRTDTFQKVWVRRIVAGAGDEALTLQSHVILASHEGDVIALDQYGHVLWRREVGSEKNEIRRLVQYDEDLIVVCDNSVYRLNAQNGITKSTIQAIDSIRDADSTGELGFFVDGSKLRSLSDGSTADHPFASGLGVSVSGRAVCVTSSDRRVTCLTPDTQFPIWTHSIMDSNTWGHSVAPIQDGTRVFVSTFRDLTAFDTTDGTILWNTSGGTEGNDIVPTEYGLLLMENTHYKLELRDPQTGEVRRVWSQPRGVRQLAVHKRFAAVADIDEVVWLIDVGGAGKHSAGTKLAGIEGSP
jgi:outer membrane protein assembly factor BamB